VRLHTQGDLPWLNNNATLLSSMPHNLFFGDV